MAAILAFCYNFTERQVAHYRDYALSKKKSWLLWLWPRTKDKAQESGEQLLIGAGELSKQENKFG